LAVLNIPRTSRSSSSAPRPYRRVMGALAGLLHLEPSILRQSFIVLLIAALLELLPGYFLGSLERYLILVPGLLVLLPPTVGLRGNTFGSLASRLGSKLHLGTMRPYLKDNSELADQIIATMLQLMFLSSLLPLVAMVIGRIIGLEFAPFSTLLFISLAAGLISGLLMFAISLGITLISFRKGWDPDNVSSPIIASSGDILTIPIMLISAWIALNIPETAVRFTSLGVLGLIIIGSVLTMVRFRKETRSILIGTFPVALTAIVISTFSGILLGASFDPYLKGTMFLLLVPAFNGQGGAVGSILGSRLSSAGYLGQDRLTILPNETGRSSALTLWLITLVLFLLLGAGGAVLGMLTGVSIPPVLFILLTMIGGATLVSLISSTIAYYIAYASFRLGLDPDNMVIPILTSLMDVVGSGSLILCILAVGLIL